MISDAVVDHPDAALFDFQMLFHLVRGELGNRDDQIGTFCGAFSARGEQFSEFRGRVVLRQDEQIVKSTNTMLDPLGRHPLVEAVKKLRGRRAKFIVQQKPAAVTEEAFAK